MFLIFPDENSLETTSSSITSSGVWGLGNKYSPQCSLSSYNNTPSLRQYLSSSAPINSTGETLFGACPPDEGIEIDDSEAFFSEDLNSTSRKRRVSKSSCTLIE